MSGFLKAALACAGRGWRVHPLVPGEKRPLLTGWPDKATTDAAQIKRWWREWPAANCGIITGPTSDVVIVDEDPRNGGNVAAESRQRGPLPKTLKARTGGGGTHRFFRCPTGLNGKNVHQLAAGIELLTGKNAVIAPSVNAETGGVYRWLNDLPLAELPPKWYPSAEEAKRPAPTLPDTIPEGERDERLTSLAGSMRRRGASEGAILAALREENEAKCQPPLSEKQLAKIAHSIGRKPPGDQRDSEKLQALEELNRTYAVVQVGGNVVILQERADREIALLTQKDFYLLLRNRFVSVPTDDGEAKRTRLADRWLEWGERREYRRLVFKPGEQVVNGEFNLWRGWAVEPSAHGRCDRFLGHLRKVVCGGNREHYEWLLDWLADIIQHPERKLGLVVALQGPQGAGKTLVGAIMKRLLGVYQVVAEKPEHVTGRFNGHLARCLLLQAEEAFWGGDRGAGVLKHLVTGEHLMIERKGIDSEEMPNYTRLLITSNDDWLWPTGMDDRRLVIFKVRGTHRTDKAYFRRLFAEMEAGGYGRLLRFLQTRAIKRRRLEVPPRTVALEEQAVHTMSPEEVWLRDLLKRGIVDGVVDADGRAHVPVGALYDSYVASVPKSRFVKNEEAFSIFLKRSLPRVKGVRYAGPHRFVSARRGYARVQSRGRVVAPLAHCRERYSSRGRAAPQTWGKPKAWIRERGA